MEILLRFSALSRVALLVLLPCQLVSCHLTISNMTGYVPELPIQHVAVDGVSGDIYVGGTNFLYHLTPDLSLVAQQSSITADITNFCPSEQSECELPPGWDDNENRVLLIDRQNNFTVACGSAFNGTCVLHHLGSINTVEARVHDVSHYEEDSLGIGESVVAFYGDTIAGKKESTYTDTGIFLGMSFNPEFNNTLVRQHAVSTKRLFQQNGRWTFDLAYQWVEFGRLTYIDLKAEHAHSFPVKYINGFTDGSFSYFTVVQRVDVDQDQYETRIVRICQQDKGYYSYTELPLKCQSSDRTRTYDLLQAAHVGPVGSKLARDLRIGAGDRALFGVFAASDEKAPDQPTGRSALCVFAFHKINEKIQQGLKKCFHQTQGLSQGLRQFSDDKSCSLASYQSSIPYNFCGTGDMHPVQASGSYKATDYLNGGGHGHHYTALTTMSLGPDTIAVMGTKSGHVHKIVLDPALQTPLKHYKNIKLDTEGPVLRDMPFDLSQDHVYVMTPHKIYKIPMKTCEHYTRCSDCLTSDDPNGCGWCGRRCTSAAECGKGAGEGEEASGEGGVPESQGVPEDDVDSDDDDDLEWVTDQCSPVIYQVFPVYGPVQGGTVVSVLGDSLTSGPNVSLSVMLADQPCDVMLNASNITRIICVTPPVQDPTEGPVTVEVEADDSSLPFTIDGVATSDATFSYVEPKLTSFSPVAGPVFGGTTVTLRGAGLLAGNNRRVTVAGVPCHIHRFSGSMIHCRTGNASQPTAGPVVLYLDDLQLSSTGLFEYQENPYVISFEPDSSYLSGDLNLKVTGFNLHLGQSIGVEVRVITATGQLIERTEDCMLPWDSSTNAIPTDERLTCPSPDLRGYALDPSPDRPVVANLTVILDRHRLTPMTFDGQVTSPQWQLRYYPDPILNQFHELFFQLDPSSDQLVIHGKYLDLMGNADLISVTVGNMPCPVTTLTSTYIVCEVPEAVLQHDSTIYDVRVTMGGSQQYEIGALQVPPPEQVSSTTIAGTIIGILALIAVVLVVGCVTFRRSWQPMRHQPIDNTTIAFNNAMETSGEGHLQGQGIRINPYLAAPGSEEFNAMPEMQRPLLEQINNELAAEISQVLIHEEHLGLGKVLGQGHFGCVYAGTLTQDGRGQRVAVKSLHQGSLAEICSFLREGIMMKDFQHPNVLTLIGVVVSSDTNMPLVVLPFMHHGDVLSFVRDPSIELTARQLLEFCGQIAEGMRYLASLKFVHRDLAARNCMLDDGRTVKVADFGLSRDIYEKDYYSAKDRTAKLPVRWMALECLERNIYNTKTDVWSFGVVMWELLTRGIVPYPMVDNVDILKFLHRGRRLQQPDHCPDHVFEVMLSCWSVSPIDRPSFSMLADKLDTILSVKPDPDFPLTIGPDTIYINVPGAMAS